MMDPTSVRNLEQIQETDGESRTPRSVKILLVALGAACILFAGLSLGGRRSSTALKKVDPLGDLVSQQSRIGKSASPKATDLSAHDVTFPGILSDDGSPTTALAAVKGAPALQPVPASSAPPVQAAPPIAADRLPVVPLPAQNVLDASPVVTRPRDSLTRAANDAAQITSPAEPSAPAGREGGYQLQVSSFRSQAEADQFALQLRARGHKAYVAEAHVAGRGTWYRVRIGPFASQRAASAYRSGFEGREHVVPFIVPPASK
ncbi:MAG: SPOR domain-containing protein [Polyangiaceae bacterium]|nr:SPOR domain-containing protein [Polyangiaceae bacterium]